MTEPVRRGGEQPSFADSAAANANRGLVRELVDFMRDNKKWWLAPIIVVVLAMTLLVVLGGSAAAPFIYTLF